MLLMPSSSPKLEPLKSAEEIGVAIERSKVALRIWRSLSVWDRTKLIASLAGELAERCDEFCQAIAIPQRNGPYETISAELLPLAEASKWLANKAPRILAPKNLGQRGLPWWLGKLRTTVHREARGVVLIISAWNYPLFLSGVQSLQALIAGNAILYKPAPGCEEIGRLWCQTLVDLGIPQDLIVLLDSEASAAQSAMQHGVDHVVLTGSSQTGRKILNQLSSTLTSSTMELSGSDAMIVLESADVKRVIASLVFSLRWNASATCMASRRIFVHEKLYDKIAADLCEAIRELGQMACQEATNQSLEELTADAMANGAVRLSGDAIQVANDRIQPIVLGRVSPESKIAKRDIFAPLVMLFPFSDLKSVIEAQEKCPYALSASVYGESNEAIRIADQLQVGFVTINDVIVPTADPRVSFGGCRESGFGVTRGVEGLLEMTRGKTVSVRKGKWLPHLDEPHESDEELLKGMLLVRHGKNWYKRWWGIRAMWNAIRKRSKTPKAK